VLERARDLLLAGRVVAIKGLGGFLLACDATNATAVQTLRDRKRRPHKPFAIMVATIQEAKTHCQVSADEEALLTSPQAPIVLLGRLPGSSVVEEVAPNVHTLGVMLPYTPLHHILLRDVGRPLVMTSGNLSEEPIAMENEEALRRLGRLADAFLLHNRGIFSRYDDSVWQVVEVGAKSVAQPVRRARGYAPFPIRLPFPVRPILAAGPDLKNTFCLARDGYAFVSQHIGDMENLETVEHLEATLVLYKHLFRLEPDQVACDLHPDYATTRFALDHAVPTRPVARVQHHHAHIAACLADNGWTPGDGPVIGVALDGTGYGLDGAIWGGEWLVGSYAGFRRAAHLEYLPLPGGDTAIRHPWRIAAGYIYCLLGPDAVPSWLFHSSPGAEFAFYRQIDRQINTPPTSSMGRLFDAVSALLRACHTATYEAQAAIELEQLALTSSVNRQGHKRHEGSEPEDAAGGPGDVSIGGGSYPFGLEEGGDGLVVRLRPLLASVLAEMQQGQPAAEIAFRFHAAVAQMIVQVCGQIRRESGIQTVALSGGCFQNRLLVKLTAPLLEEARLRVLLHRQVPCNDGGVSLGQAVMAGFGDEVVSR
jgi:hydrogenase maturation protein HypF